LYLFVKPGDLLQRLKNALESQNETCFVLKNLSKKTKNLTQRKPETSGC